VKEGEIKELSHFDLQRKSPLVH